jgi:uncharacterized protein YegJ (DUF2314 family)
VILVRVVLLVLLFPFILLARLLGLGRSNLAYLPEGHPEMAKAIEQAKTSLPEFRHALQNPTPRMDNFAVKARFPCPGGTEHCWVDNVVAGQGGFTGTLANEPKELAGLALGGTVEIVDEQISDWTYSLDGVYQGHFTTKVLLSRMPKRMRREAESLFGWDGGPSR